MKRFLQFAAVAAAFVVISGAAQAQFRTSGPALAGVWNPVIGSGGVYEVTPKNGKPATMEMAVVGKELVDGKEGYWFETSFKLPNGKGGTVSKVLFVREGNEIIFKRMIMQMPGRPPMDMSAMVASMMHPQDADIRSTSDDLGPAIVTTPAGTFACEHYKTKDGKSEMWIKAKAGPYGLVKSVSDTGTMILTRVITDAKDKITGTPRPMQMGMPQRRP